MNEILDRIYEAMEGVPGETRRGFIDGTSIFERILPGADRMYPDTDLPLTKIPRDKVNEIKKRLNPRPWELSKKYSALSVQQKLHHQIITSPKNTLINKLFELDIAHTLFITALTETYTALKRNGFNLDGISDDKFLQLFSNFKKGAFFREHIPPLFISLSKGASVEKAISDLKLETGDSIKNKILHMIGRVSQDFVIKTRERKKFKNLEEKTLQLRKTNRKVTFITGQILREIGFIYSAKEISLLTYNHLKAKGSL